ncbi:MAG: 4-alpha-glucanotransferase, partial [Gammaproteobacteria bacterium]|nr:4-alpha-glucanotransferase [Gammaproteobacteria bacterium]
DIRHRDETALQLATEELQTVIKQTIFEQFVFFTQWSEIKAYANKHDVELYGDMPIFMGVDSADVWASHENFLIDQDGQQTYVAGVPPDAFSDTGQRWGNPLYNWDKMLADDFAWWKQRFTTQLALFDIIRLDHFRGLEASWYIPAHQDTAENGFWQKVPGDALLQSLFAEFNELPLIAEDLGVITDEVLALKDKYNLPGMRVLQFGFDANKYNPHLPHNYKLQDVVYTGTHDNDTTIGWLHSRQYHVKFLNQYLGRQIIDECMGCHHFVDESTLLSIIQLAMSSVSFLCVIPMQDILALGSDARMNTPGTTTDNWLWRFNWEQVKPEHLEKIRQLIEIYAR